MSTPRQSRGPSLSILVPVYNEASTILQVLRRLEQVEFPVPVEVVIVDDGSTDGSRGLLDGLNMRASAIPMRVYFHEQNRGKGAAIQTALRHARGQITVIQDADLELDPQDIARLLERFLRDSLEVCYGSRFLERDASFYRLPTYWANRLLNLLCNVINQIWITDFNTCYKMLNTRVLRRLDLTSRGFAMEAEITTKLARLGFRIHELPIRYRPRTRDEGKKIHFGDVFKYVAAMFRFRLMSRSEMVAHSAAAEPLLLRPAAVTIPRAGGGRTGVDGNREAWDVLWRPTDAAHVEVPAAARRDDPVE